MAPKLPALPKKSELSDMSVKDLKSLCAKRDIAQGGSKDDLIKKLLSFQKSADKEAAAKAAARAEKAAAKAKASASSTSEPAAKKEAAPTPEAPSTAQPAVAPSPEPAAPETAPSKPEVTVSKPAPAPTTQPPATTSPAISVSQSPASASPAKPPPVTTSASPAKPPPVTSASQSQASASPAKPPLKSSDAVPQSAVVTSAPPSTSPAKASSAVPALSPIKAVSAPSPGKPATAVAAPAPESSPSKAVHGKGVKISPGTLVTLKGLSKAELNGKRAEVLEWLKTAGRWHCRLIESDETVNFRPRNIVPDDCGFSPGLLVTLQGLSKVELNGKRAELKQWLKDSGRWQCRLMEGGDDLVNFRPRNIVPDDSTATQIDASTEDFEGQCVVLKGLEAKPELNGARFEALECLEENGRWRCQLISSDGTSIFQLRAANLELMPAASAVPEAKRRKLS